MENELKLREVLELVCSWICIEHELASGEESNIETPGDIVEVINNVLHLTEPIIANQLEMFEIDEPIKVIGVSSIAAVVGLMVKRLTISGSFIYHTPKSIILSDLKSTSLMLTDLIKEIESKEI